MGRFLHLFVLLAASTIGLANPCLVINDPVYPPTPEASILSVQSDIKDFLSTHNSFRAKHGASPLVWDGSLANTAQEWANKCQFKHSGGPNGENLAAGTAKNYDNAAAVRSWTNESSSYDPNNPKPSHFTQVVWKSSKKLGCAVQMCKNIFEPKFGVARFVVCEYFPPGNIIGRFKENVQV